MLKRLVTLAALLLSAGLLSAQRINLPSSKELIEPVPGHPQRLNSLPVSMAVSPDGRYVVTVNAGYGTFESNYDQSLAVLDTQTLKVEDFPDKRTEARASKQTLYSGLAFSGEGQHLYASMGSLADPEGHVSGDTGSGIIVYGFAAGKITPERFIHLPLVQLAPGHHSNLLTGAAGSQAVPFPAAITTVETASGERLLVAGNWSDDVWLIDPASGKIERRFDLAESNTVPSTYPISLIVSRDGKRAFVALWNASEIAELDLVKGTVEGKLALLKPRSDVAPGTHPCAFQFSPDEKTLYVALSNRDAVAAVNVSGTQLAVKGYFDTRLPGQSYFGAEPVALAMNASGSRLYVANLGSDAVAVMDTRKLTAHAEKQGMVEPIGFIPTEWMPISMASIASKTGGMLYVATDKGKGTGPNNFAQRVVQAETHARRGATTYIGTLLYGSLAVISEQQIATHLTEWTASVLDSNRMKAGQAKIRFADGRSDPIRHVIYIIKENRTYDQILGDLQKDGKPVGNGDPDLSMYGAAITPNEHRLALQFGVLDNFFDSGEVSGDGHVWSNAAIGTDYLEKTWQQNYRGGQRTYDYEGVVAEGYPLLQKIPDVNEPASGYLWGDLARHGKSYYHFGEFIASTFCGAKATSNPQLGPMLEGPQCARKAIEPGQPIPADWGGGVNKWPWAIPLLAGNTPTKPELVGHFAAESPDFNLMIPDQIRINVIERHLKQWIADKNNGNDTMPAFITVRLGNDHTAGTRPGGPTPQASVADNDLALGRLVDDISHSPFWSDTAICVLEDDAQNGGDHVDAHRSIALVISKYAPHGKDGMPFVDSHFYSTVSMVRTMEELLGLPPMNNNDAFSSVIASLFTGPGDQPAYDADTMNRENGLIYTANQATAVGAKESMKMDFTHEDRADARKLNVILWKQAMGNKPVPAMLLAKPKPAHKNDDDD